MFDYPFDSPFFGPRSNRRHYRSSRGAHISYMPDSPFSAFEDIHHLTHLITVPPSPMGMRTYTRARDPTFSPSTTNLPSRVNALNRRGATLSTYLAHLAAVMEPLKSAKVNEMSELDLKDIIQEGQGLHKAIQDFKEQFEEVRDMLKGLTIERRGTVRKLQGDDEKGWKGGRKGL